MGNDEKTPAQMDGSEVSQVFRQVVADGACHDFCLGKHQS